MEKPEILAEAQKKLFQKTNDQGEKKEQDALLDTLDKSPKLFDKLRQSDSVPKVGEGKQEVFAFVSPYCPHCQHLITDMFTLTDKNPAHQATLLVVADKDDIGDFIAARALVTAARLKKFKEFFEAMRKRVNRLEEKDVFELASSIWPDTTEFKKIFESPEVKNHLKEVDELRTTLNIGGFPTMIYKKSHAGKDGRKFKVIPGRLPTLEKLAQGLSE